MLRRGYWGTSVDDVCRAVGVSKGAFFHYFEDKEELALAALDQFVFKMVKRVREAVAGMDPADAYGRICAYCDLVADAAQVQRSQQGCLIAAFVLETHSDDGAFAKRCAAHFGGWIGLLRQEFANALSLAGLPHQKAAAELAQYCVCVIEGALILARGRGDPLVVVSAMDHFKRYLGTVLGRERAHRKAGDRRASANAGAGAPGARQMQPALGRNRVPTRRSTMNARVERDCGGPRSRTKKEATVSK